MKLRHFTKFLLGLVGVMVIALGLSILTPTSAITSSYTVTDLGNLTVNAINDAGQIVGSKNDHGAILWDKGKITNLGTLGRRYSYAYDINNKGQVVGEVKTKKGIQHAFLWQNGVMKDLNTLIPASSGWKLLYATDINNKGQIIGQGSYNGQSRAFLLTPTE